MADDDPKEKAQQETGACHTFSQFIALLEGGTLHDELTTTLRDIAAGLSNHVLEHGGAPKGRLTLSLDFKLEKGVFEIDAKVDTKMPRSPRGRSIMWATPSNFLTPFNPKQLRLFDGLKAVDRDGEVRSVDG